MDDGTTSFLYSNLVFLQACLFYVPHLVWKKLEEGKMSTISDGVRKGTASVAEFKEKSANVAKNLAEYINMDEAGHFKYGLGFIGSHVSQSCSISDFYRESHI